MLLEMTSYAKAVKIADEQISDALLALLDDAAFRAGPGL